MYCNMFDKKILTLKKIQFCMTDIAINISSFTKASLFFFYILEKFGKKNKIKEISESD